MKIDYPTTTTAQAAAIRCHFDALANCFTFYPDGHVAPAVVGPGFPDGLTRIGKNATAGWVPVGDEVGR